MSTDERRYILGGLTESKLDELGGRCHVVLDGRYVTVLRHRGRLYALDSPCYHAAGPLGEGPVVDIEDMVCIRCPWHQFLVDLETGKEVTRKTRPPDFSSSGGVFMTPSYPMEPLQDDAYIEGSAVKGKLVQRVHRVALTQDEETREMEVTVFIASEDQLKASPLPSDASSCHAKRGAMCMEIRDIKARGFDK